MQVPKYDTQQVAPSALGAPQPRGVAPAAFANPFAEEVSRALGKGAMGFAEAALKIQQRNDLDAAFRAETGLKDQYLQYENDIAQNRRGANAAGVMADANQWWQDNIAKHAETLANDEQRRIFMRRAEPMRLSSVHGFSRYEVEQGNIAFDESASATKNASKSMAAATLTDDAVALARAQIMDTNNRIAERKGVSPEDLNRRDMTELHTQVIQGLAQNSPLSASAYFNAHKGEIDGRAHAELQAFAQKTTATAAGTGAASAVWSAMRPATDKDPIELDKMGEAVRAKLADNPEAQKVGVSALRELASEFDAARREREHANEATVWRAYQKGVGARALRLMPEFSKMPEEKGQRLLDYVENRAYTQGERYRQDQTRKFFAAYSIYSRPENLAGMSEDQLLTMLPTMGDALVGNLIERKRALAKDSSKIIDAHIDQHDFDRVSQEAGLRPFEKSKSEDDKSRLGELHFVVLNAIDSEQQAKGRKLSRKEKMDIARREINNKVLSDSWLGLSTKSTPIGVVPFEKQKDTYVMVDGKRVRLADIDAAERALIIQKRRERGLPITEQAIAETWARAHAVAEKPRETDRANQIPQ